MGCVNVGWRGVTTTHVAAAAAASAVVILSLAAMFAANWLSSTLMSIGNVELTKSMGGDAVLTGTVRNTGSKPIERLVITVGDERVTVNMPGGSLQPGRSTSIIVRLNGWFVAGDSYAVTFEAYSPDGDSYAITVNVKCRW